MIVSGVFLLFFIVFHVWQFKYGAGISEGYVATVDGNEVRDLYRLVAETFRNPLFAGLYMIAMVVLGFHLRHGFWSAFQSLGVVNERNTDCFYRLSLFLAVIFKIFGA